MLPGISPQTKLHVKRTSISLETEIKYIFVRTRFNAKHEFVTKNRKIREVSMQTKCRRQTLINRPREINQSCSHADRESKMFSNSRSFNAIHVPIAQGREIKEISCGQRTDAERVCVARKGKEKAPCDVRKEQIRMPIMKTRFIATHMPIAKAISWQRQASSPHVFLSHETGTVKHNTPASHI